VSPDKLSESMLQRFATDIRKCQLLKTRAAIFTLKYTIFSSAVNASLRRVYQHCNTYYHSDNDNAYRVCYIKAMLCVSTAMKALTATTEDCLSTNHSAHDSSPVPAISWQCHHCWRCHEELFTTQLGGPRAAPCRYYRLSVHLHHRSANGASNGRQEPPHALSWRKGTITATRHKRGVYCPTAAIQV